MQCNHCQGQHPSHFVYCPNTSKVIDLSGGHNLTYQSTEFCPSCGTKNELSYSYCVNCGHSHLTKTQKKNAFNRMFENTISNIKIPSKVNTENLKSSSKEHINYIKRNKLILVPIIISLVIMIIATFWIKSSALSSIGDELEYYDDETMVLAALLKPELIEEMIYYDYDIEVDLPNFTSLPIMMGLIHNADLDFSATVSAMGEEEGVKFSVNNLFTGLLLIPIIALIIGGIIYGRMAIKNNWPFYKGLIYSVLGYTIVMAVLSIFARASFSKKVEEFYDLATLKISLSSSFIDIVVTSIILSTLFFGSFALISYYGKSVIEKTMEQSKWIVYAFTAFVATLIGLVIHFIYSLVFIMEELLEYGPEIPHVIMSIYTSIGTWLMSLLGLFQLNDGYEKLTYRALFNSEKNREMVDVLGSDVLFQNALLLFLISVIIIAAVGFVVSKVQQVNVKEIAIFGLMFTIIQFFIINVFSIKFSMDYIYDETTVSIGFEMVSTLVFAFIISFASFYGGSYLRKVLSK